MCIWRAVRGERSEQALSLDPERSPRVLLPVLGAAEGEESGWWRDAEWLEMMKVRLLWLFIGVLSRAGWMDGVITDVELAVLIICACSSELVNKTSLQVIQEQ